MTAFDLGRVLSPTVPVLLQSESAECGLACLAMVAGFHGHHLSLHELRQIHPTGLRGMTLRQLIEVADRLELDSRPVRLELQELSRLSRPAVLHWRFDHYVVLERVHGKRVHIIDPARGRVRLTLDEVSDCFTGVALELEPKMAFRPKRPVPSLGLRDFLGHVRGLTTPVTQVLALSLTLELVSLTIPYFSQVVVDQVLVARDFDILSALAVGFLFMVCFRTVSDLLRQWVLAYLRSSLHVVLTSRVFGHMMSLPMAFFQQRNIGDLTTRFGSVREIQELLTTSFVQALVDGVLVVVTLGVMFAYDSLLASVSAAFLGAYTILRWATFNPIRDHTDMKVGHTAREQSVFLETLRGMTPLKTFGDESRRFSVWQNLLVDVVNSDIRLERYQILNRVLNDFLALAEYVLIVWLGARAIMNGGFTVGMLMAFLAFRQRFAQQAHALIDKLAEYRLVGVHLQRIADVVLTPPERNIHGIGFEKERLDGHIRVDNVTYRYGTDEKPVLERLSLEVKPGESVALIGPSGAGKTTLLKVMLGLVRPESGRVLVDGVDIAVAGLREYRGKVAAVMQDDVLFSGTVRDNICMFDPAPDRDRMVWAAKAASIYDDIAALPMGFSSFVGDMGSSLSGGQKQRVLIARALYRRPSVLFLDEATSHLDRFAERRINLALKELGITVVMIAHRKETIRLADRVIPVEPHGAAAAASAEPEGSDELELR